MRKNIDNLVYVRHIRDAVHKIMLYKKDHSYQNFIDSEWDQSAIIRYIAIIGEAASNVEDSFRQTYMGIPWRKIINLRNVLIHDYTDIDVKIMWEIINQDIPELQTQIEKILNK